MPSAVKMIYTADSMEYEAAVGRMVTITNGFTKGLAANIQAANAQIGAGSIPQNMGGQTAQQAAAAGKNFGKGFGMAAGAATAPMFFSVLRDSFASLASGAPISQIVGQQLPQVLQAFTMMGKRIMMLAGGFGAAIGGAFLANFVSKKAAEGIYNSGGYDKQNEALRLRAEKLRELTKEANAYKEKMDEANAAAEKHRLGLAKDVADSNMSTAELIQENRIKNAKGEPERHRLALELAKTRREMASIEYDKTAEYRNSPIMEQRLAFSKAERAYEEAKQGVIDEDRRHKEALASNQPARRDFNVTDRQSIGAFSASSFQVSLLDANKRTADNTKMIAEFMKTARGPAHEGSF